MRDRQVIEIDNALKECVSYLRLERFDKIDFYLE